MDVVPEEPNDWLKDAVNDRSLEISRQSLFGVFHRMRVVEEIFLSEYERKGQIIDKEDLIEITKEKLDQKSSERKENIKDFPNLKVNESKPEWYEAYDLSDRVIEDGVDWYLRLTNYFTEDDFLLLKYFGKFNRDLFVVASDNSRLFKFLEEHVSFSDSVVSLVANNIHETKKGRIADSPTEDPTQAELETVVQKGSESESKFIDGVKSLSDEFDRIYNEQLDH
jgi:hypothetical protein